MTVKVPSLGITHLDTAGYADLQMEFEKAERIDIWWFLHTSYGLCIEVSPKYDRLFAVLKGVLIRNLYKISLQPAVWVFKQHFRDVGRGNDRGFSPQALFYGMYIATSKKGSNLWHKRGKLYNSSMWKIHHERRSFSLFFFFNGFSTSFRTFTLTGQYHS